MSVSSDKWQVDVRIEADREMSSTEVADWISKGLPGVSVSIESMAPLMDSPPEIIHQDLSDAAHLRLPEDVADD